MAKVQTLRRTPSQWSRFALFLPWVVWTACSPSSPETNRPANPPSVPATPTSVNPQAPTHQESTPTAPTAARPEAPASATPLPQEPGTSSQVNPPPPAPPPPSISAPINGTPSPEGRPETVVPQGRQELIRLRYFRPVSEPTLRPNSPSIHLPPQAPRPQPAPTHPVPTRYRLDHESTILWIHTNLRGEFTKLSHQGENFLRDELESENGSSLTHQGAPIGLLFLRCSARPHSPSQERCILTIHYLINFTTGAMGQYQVEISSELQPEPSDNSGVGHAERLEAEGRRSLGNHRENTPLDLRANDRPTGQERQSLRWVAREWASSTSANHDSSPGDLVRTLCAYVHERRGTPVGILTLRSDCPFELP